MKKLSPVEQCYEQKAQQDTAAELSEEEIIDAYLNGAPNEVRPERTREERRFLLLKHHHPSHQVNAVREAEYARLDRQFKKEMNKHEFQLPKKQWNSLLAKPVAKRLAGAFKDHFSNYEALLAKLYHAWGINLVHEKTDEGHKFSWVARINNIGTWLNSVGILELQSEHYHARRAMEDLIERTSAKFKSLHNGK